MLRAASSPGAIKAVLEALRDTDVRSLLPRIATPTLVLHRRGDRAVRIEAGRHLAAAIPGARLVEFDGAATGSGQAITVSSWTRSVYLQRRLGDEGGCLIAPLRLWTIGCALGCLQPPPGVKGWFRRCADFV
jgi:hypothetical protein